jgi:hypothetical protein
MGCLEHKKAGFPTGTVLSICRRVSLLGLAVLASGAAVGSSTGPLPAAAETPPASSAGPRTDLAPGGNYVSGTTLVIPRQGWAFTIPAHWHATVFEDSELPFLLSDEGYSMGMIFPLAQATAEEVENELAQPLSLSQGISFVPTGALVRTDSRLRRSYMNESTVGRALAAKGPADRWIIFFLMGPAGESEAFDAVLDQLADSTEFEAERVGSEPREGI